jgi:hypothetical protein
LAAEVANYRFPLDHYRNAIARAVNAYFPMAGLSDFRDRAGLPARAEAVED